MTKQENGSNDTWDCETDYEEDASPWILFEDQRPVEGQKCLVWPQQEVLMYDEKADLFVTSSLHAKARMSTVYWMPIPDDPVSPEERVENITGTLADIFSKSMMPLIGETLEYTKETLLSALGVPMGMLAGSDPPKVTDVTDNGNGEVEFELELPLPPQYLSGTYAAEDDTDGNDS